MQHNYVDMQHDSSHMLPISLVYIMLHVDINKLHVNIIMLHVDIIYLACKGQKYATIANIKIKITRQKFSLYYKEL